MRCFTTSVNTATATTLISFSMFESLFVIKVYKLLEIGVIGQRYLELIQYLS